MTEKDTYRTLAGPSEEVIFKDRSSKFLGYAFPVTNEEAIKQHLDALKTVHHRARHWCYAWRLGTDTVQYRVNDDGEPTNSAGQPIYGQILSKELTNVLVVVVRYFGGTKLGIGGLVNAYRTTSEMALEAAQIIEKTIDVHFKIAFDYKDMNTVMRILKEQGLNIKDQKLEMRCELLVSVRKNNAEMIRDIFKSLHQIAILEN
ncbi:MAG: YigZ family protein [Flavobacteriaceae bacterium]|nr:YigZ family protein [Flavobacteriaceae bacterium]